MNTDVLDQRNARALPLADCLLNRSGPFDIPFDHHQLAVFLREKLDPAYAQFGIVDEQAESWEWYLDYSQYLMGRLKRLQDTLTRQAYQNSKVREVAA